MIEVININGKHRVQITFREPFAYFFEIAMHVGIFDHPRDAHYLADKVRKAVNDLGLSKSVACILDEKLWNYSSSEYDRHCKAVNPNIAYAASKYALADDEKARMFD
ncbi:hypothetical protein phiOC_p239 [Ochrobactrum phage vB_OspM_OC]|nr:hypothetical protein phiOC_p239 [Ochrobactrum phage vB_OspM_OC]